MSSLKISEIFQSIQGEGPSAGEPATFVRLAHCNLTCTWCDTKYTWDFTQFRYEDEVSRVEVGEVVQRVRGAARVILTGGEPLLQQPAIAELLSAVATESVVEIETNGTILPLPELLARVDQWNVSPKLSSAGDSERRRLRATPLETLRDTGRAWLKLVIGSDADLGEADALLARSGWPRERVLFMPEARTRDELSARMPAVRAACDARGIGLSPRLHVERWDGRRGV